MVHSSSTPQHNNIAIDRSFYGKNVAAEDGPTKGLNEFDLDASQKVGVKVLVDKFNTLFNAVDTQFDEKKNSAVLASCSTVQQELTLTEAQINAQKKEIQCSTVQKELELLTLTEAQNATQKKEIQCSTVQEEEEVLIQDVKEEEEVLIQDVKEEEKVLIQDVKEEEEVLIQDVKEESATEVVGFLLRFLSKSTSVLQSDLNGAADSLFKLFSENISSASLGSSIDSRLKLDEIFDIVINMIKFFLVNLDLRFLANIGFLIRASSNAFKFFDKEKRKGTVMERYPVWHGREGAKWEDFYLYSFDGYPYLKDFYLRLFDPKFINLGTTLLQVLLEKMATSYGASKCENFYDDVIHVTKYELIKGVRETFTTEDYNILCNEYLKACACDTVGRRDDEKFNKLKLIDMSSVSYDENHAVSLLRKR